MNASPAGMPAAASLLRAAVRAAPRRYRMPPLPADATAASAAGAEAALAFALEAIRTGRDGAQAAGLFTRSLSALIAQAIRTDATLQALVLRAEQPSVGQYVELAAQEAADRRRVASVVDAFAHPGKLRSRPMDAESQALANLHERVRAQAWGEVRAGARALRVADEALRAKVEVLLADAALARLERLAGLRQDSAVQRYLALLASQGPLAGTEAAADRGRAAARAGEAVEAQALHAFATVARWMEGAGPLRHRAAQGLRPAEGFPPAARGAKDEWDVALLREARDGAWDVVLLAECKAAPAAASSDWPRLLAGLRRLAQVDAAQDYGLADGDATLRVHGASLRALAPREDLPPPNVFYACIAAEQRIPLLAPAARAMLLQEPDAVAFAQALARGARPPHAQLAPLVDKLAREHRLRPVLHQYETARRAREAMLHPHDLVAAAAEAFGVDAQGRPRNR